MAIAQEGVHFSPEALETAQRFGAIGDLAKVAAFTRDFFGAEPVVRVAEDPEILGWTHLVLEVVIAGTVEEASTKNSEWHHAVTNMLLRSPDLFCLSIDLRDDR
jgi:hypothetical protein